MKVVKILVVIVVLVVVLLVGVLWYANRYVQSPAFQQQALAAARQAIGTEVKVDDWDVSLLRGVTLSGVTIGNPPGYPGNLLTAQKFVLRYRLLPLLRRQVHVHRLIISDPVIMLARNAQGEWNYEKLGSTAPTGAVTAAAAPAAPGGAPMALPLDLVLSKLALQGGTLLVVKEGGTELVRMGPIELATSVQMRGTALSGSGRASIETINCANAIFVRAVAAPVNISSTEIKLAPVQGQLAGGRVTGEAALKLAGGFKYVLQLQADDGDVATLLREAGVSRQVLTGKLRLSTTLEGTGGLPTIRGSGQADIVGGRLLEIPVLNLLATLLQISELRNLQFDECRMEFSIADNQMQTTLLRIKSPQVQITGTGTMSLADYTLNHNLTLALAKDMVAKVPKEIRAVFTERPDGFVTLDFKVTGPYDSPKTDLKERLVKGAVGGLLQKLVK